MSAPVRVVFDATLFDVDGEPWFGSLDSDGEIVESDFQTPSAELSHPRPYLRDPDNFTASEVSFVEGRSSIGSIVVGVNDFRLDPTDQATGIVTSRIGEAAGARLVLRRWLEDESRWAKVFDGPVARWSVDEDLLLAYRFEPRDQREFERDQPLFFSSFVLFGAEAAQGPAIDYGRLPGGGYMLPAIAPWPSIVAGGITRFKRGADQTWLGQTVYSGFTPGGGTFIQPETGTPLAISDFDFNLSKYWTGTLDSDGLFRYRDFQIWWRDRGSSGDWTRLREMPRAFANAAVAFPNEPLPNYSEGGSAAFLYFPAPTLYFGSLDSSEVPYDDQDIEFLVLATHITDETPFFWDGGTLGDLLQEIADGLHTDEVPRERYDYEAMAAFKLASMPARFVLREPVLDRKAWVEENIYKAGFVGPALSSDLAVRPTSWLLPSNLETVPLLDPEFIQPVGMLEGAAEIAIGAIEYTYIQEHLDPQKTVVKEKAKKFLGITYGHKMQEVVDDSRADFARLVEVPVTIRTVDEGAVAGATTLRYTPATIRSITRVDGRPLSGDSTEDLGQQITTLANERVFPRFRGGAMRYEATVPSTSANLAIATGDWLRVRVSWLPELSTGRREFRRYMQVYAIADQDPSLRRISLLDGGVADPTGDPDVVSPTGEDCLDGGALEFVPSGRAARVFMESGWVYNGCSHDVTFAALAIAGGGGGGSVVAGGGGGAGGVGQWTDLVIPGGGAVYVTVGVGGVPSAPGTDSIIWINRSTGLPMDPNVDDPDDAYLVKGGGEGGGNGSDGGGGGSGGGGGAQLPISGGGSHGGGAPADPDYGSAGGNGNDAGGIATCRSAAGGGGGSLAGAGAPGVSGSPSPQGGRGGAATPLTAWGVTAGGGGGGGSANQQAGLGSLCGGNFSVSGTNGESGHGAGGFGGGATGGPGTDGVVILSYAGPAPKLEPPPIHSADQTTQDGITICVAAADWPAIAIQGYKVRLDYAVTDLGDSEPDASSGEWRLAGYLTAPGCVTTIPLPTNKRIWQRATAEAEVALPSGPSSTITVDLPCVPGILAGPGLTIGAAGAAVVTWEPNGCAEGVKIRGLVAADGYDFEPPLPALAETYATYGEYAVAEAVGQGEWITLDLEFYQTYEDPQGSALVVDDFQRADSSLLGGDWLEHSGAWAVVSDRAKITSATTGIAENDGGATGESFVQAVLRVDDEQAQPGVIARFDYDSLHPLGYELQARVADDQWWLVRRDAASAVVLTTVEDAYVVQGANICNGTWAVTRAGAGNNSGYGFSRTATIVTARIKTCGSIPNYGDIVRGILVFNLSTLTGPPTECSIDLYLVNKVEDIAAQSVVLTGATPADPTTIAQADFAQVGSVAFSAAKTLASIAVSTHHTFTLNAAGLAALAAAFYTSTQKFCVGIRIESDQLNAEPGWVNNLAATVEFASLNNATAGFRPTLSASLPALDTAAESMAANVDLPVQLYVEDGVQEAWANGVLLSAYDTTFDGQDSRTIALRHGVVSGTPGSMFDDVIWCSTKYVRVTGLPSGYKAKVLNLSDEVVATDTEGAGVALVDCSMFGGATEVIPVAGWAALMITNGADVEITRWEGAVYPGLVGAFDQDAESLVLHDLGRTYRVSQQRPENQFVLWRDADYVMGDLLTAAADGELDVLPGNVTTILKYLSQEGTGSTSAEPVWRELSVYDLLEWPPSDAAGVLVNDGSGGLTWGSSGSVALSNITGYGADGGYIRSSGSAWVRVSGLALGDATGNLLYARLPTGTGAWDTGVATTITITRSLTVSGTLTGTLTGSAATLTTPRTIGGVSFDGSANITVATATGGFTVSGGALALGANDLTMTGSLGATGARLTKGWFTDLQVTNAIAGSVTGNAATATALQNARTINGVSFDGTANIAISATGITTGNLPYAQLPTGNGSWDTGVGTTITVTRSLTVSGTLTGTLTGSASTLTTTRTIWGQNFNGSADITGSLTAVTNITGGASSMVIQPGTGNSRTLSIRPTTSGGVATEVALFEATQITMDGSKVLYTPSASHVIQWLANTVDGSDDAIFYFYAGGANSNARGAGFFAAGNESSVPGQASIETGNVTGAILNIATAGVDRMMFHHNGRINIAQGLKLGLDVAATGTPNGYIWSPASNQVEIVASSCTLRVDSNGISLPTGGFWLNFNGTSGTDYFWQPATHKLEVVANAVAIMRWDGTTALADGDTNTLLNRKAAGAEASVRIKWKDFTALAGGDKVMLCT